MARAGMALAAGLAAFLAAAPAWADGARLLPDYDLFDPLVADPRWAHFSAAWHNWGGDDDLDDVGAVSFGEYLTLYQQPTARGGEWSVGIQAAVFAIFDLNGESSDLINADYWVGVPLAWEDGPWQAVARLYHQSSHLGDEFLLGNRSIQRVNLSYEAVDVKLSRHFMGDVLRLYGGLGLILHREPDDLGRAMAQLGVEYRAPFSWGDGRVRPIAAIDLQGIEETGWEIDVSVRTGVQITSRAEDDARLLVTLEYYNGRNPNGQFFRDAVDFWGVGVHIYF